VRKIKKQRRRISCAVFVPVWGLVRVFQKMQTISTLGRLSVLMIKIRKSVEKDWKSFDFQSKSFGGDKRDRTADLMTASWYRFVISNVLAPNTSVLSAKSAEFHSDLSTASTYFHAHLGHNLGQKIQSTQTVVRILIKLILGFVIRSKAIDQISKEYRGHFIFRNVYL